MFVGGAADRSQEAQIQLVMDLVRRADEPVGATRRGYRRLWEMEVRERFSDGSKLGPEMEPSCPMVFRLFRGSTSPPGPRLDGRSSSSSRPRLLLPEVPFMTGWEGYPLGIEPPRSDCGA